MSREDPARRRASRSLKVVRYKPDPGLANTARDVLGRIKAGETIALAVVEVGRGGEITVSDSGSAEGFRHLLVAGSVYLKRHLVEDEA